MEFFEWFADLLTRRGWWELGKEYAIPLTALAVTVVLGLLGILASLIVGAASVAVAYYSWRTSQRATRIAEDAAEAERRRDERAEAREQSELNARYEEKLTGATFDVLSTCAIWFERRHDDPDATPNGLMAAVAKAMMISRDEDRKVFEKVLDVTGEVGEYGRERMPLMLSAITVAFTDWRNGTSTANETVEALHSETLEKWEQEPATPTPPAKGRNQNRSSRRHPGPHRA